MNTSTIYPGQFSLSTETEKILASFRTHKPLKRDQLPVEMREDAYSYHISVPLPGLRKENIVLYLHGRILYLLTIGEQSIIGKRGRQHRNPGTHIASIPVPQNSNPAFMSAEYRSGTLYLCITKDTGNSPEEDIRFIVY